MTTLQREFQDLEIAEGPPVLSVFRAAGGTVAVRLKTTSRAWPERSRVRFGALLILTLGMLVAMNGAPVPRGRVSPLGPTPAVHFRLTQRRAASMLRQPPVRATTGVGHIVFSTPQDVQAFFVGASITSGWFSTSVGHSFPTLVAQVLRRAGSTVQVSVEATPGATAAQAAWWSYPSAQNLLVVQLSTNDFNEDVPVRQYASAYSKVLSRLRAASPFAQLVCLGVWDPSSGTNTIGATVAEYDQAVQQACFERGGRFVRLSTIYDHGCDRGPAGAPTVFGPSDDYHPNNYGQQAIAQAILAVAFHRLDLVAASCHS